MNFESISKNQIPGSLYENKGFVLIDGNYCIHMQLQLYNFDIISDQVQFNELFEIELTFDTPLYPQTLSKETPKEANSFLINPRFAQHHLQKNVPSEINETSGWINFTGEYFKMGIGRDGIYRITYDLLSDYGINPGSISPSTFQLYYKGEEVPVFVKGEADGTFNKTDYIEFPALINYNSNYRETSSQNEPYKNYTNVYSDTTVYWLTWETGDGLRVDTTTNQTSFYEIIEFYDHVEHYERDVWLDYYEDNLITRNYPEWRPNETWNWWTQNPGTRKNNVVVNNLYPNRDAKAFVKIQSWAGDVKNNTYHVSLTINDDDYEFDKSYMSINEQKVLEAAFNSNLLNNGSNTINLHSYQTEASINSFFGDWYEIEYPRYNTFKDDSLIIGWSSLKNAAEAKLFIKDVNDPSSINIYKYWSRSNYSKITSYSIEQDNSISFIDTVDNNLKYFIFDTDKIRTPKIYYKKQFKNLAETNIQADYIIITHPKFIEKSEEYKDFLESAYDVKVIIVDIHDIYDEFNYGFYAPEPIREFLKTAYTNWQPPSPQYVLLIGDSNLDYKNNAHIYRGVPKVKDYVPSYGIPSSDVWFTVWDTTGVMIQNLDIGRLPVTEVEELDWYLEKHKNYLLRQYDESNKNYILFSGGKQSEPAELNLLKGVNDSIKAMVAKPPVGGNATHFYKTTEPPSDFGPETDRFTETISQGGLFISYVGHSGVQIWDNSIVNISQLKNDKNINPLITDFGCSTGRFSEPEIISFSELFINDKDGQAIAYVGNSSLGFISTSTSFPLLFYDRLLRDSTSSISGIHSLAKRDLLSKYSSNGVYKVFALCNSFFGDPIIKISIPRKPNLTCSETNVNLITQDISDSKDSVSIKFSYKNLGAYKYTEYKIGYVQLWKEDTLIANEISKFLPAYNDSVIFSLPVKNLPGIHTLKLSLDVNDNIAELDEDDNTTEIEFFVPSSQFKPVLTNDLHNSQLDRIEFVNPNYTQPNENRLVVEVADNMEFINSVENIVEIDTLVTKFNLQNYNSGKRIFLRTKTTSPGSQFSSNISFTNEKGETFYSDDSLSFANYEKENLEWFDEGLKISPALYNFEVLSSGFNDGRVAMVKLNEANYVTYFDRRGHHVVVFDELTMEFIDYQYFNISTGSTARDNYINFLDSIDPGHLVFFTICDEGSVGLNEQVKSKIKEFGSTKIDSLGWRGSWAMIGKKGINQAVEMYKPAFEGMTRIDTVIQRKNTQALLISPVIGPAANWNYLAIKVDSSINSNIKITPYGIRKNEEKVKLNDIEFVKGNINLDMISAAEYPLLQFEMDFTNNDTAEFSFDSFGVDFNEPAEFVLNDQVVYCEQDTILRNEELSFSVWLKNVGKTDIQNIDLVIEVFSNNELIETYIDTNLVITGRRNFHKMNFNYTVMPSFAPGKYSMRIAVDPYDKIVEYYEDNNTFEFPFYVKENPVTSVNSVLVSATFDGNEIYNGDFVSPNPQIDIQLDITGSFPVDDSNSVKIYLNEAEIDRLDLSMRYETQNNKIVYTYKPELEKGEYTLKVFGENVVSADNQNETYSRTFNVSGEAKILYTYNYPNPFSENTYFTFKLTQIPSELRIKIYTVAGRLIKEIKLNSSQLNFDFNRIYWDGRDQDGDIVASGTYLYKIIADDEDKIISTVGKLAVIR